MRRKQRAGRDEVTVTLTRPHEHAGECHAAGDRLTVRRSLVPTLERLGVIEPGGDAAEPPEPEPSPDPDSGSDPEPMGPAQ